MASSPETLYARDDDHLAYQVVGDGGPDLLYVPASPRYLAPLPHGGPRFVTDLPAPKRQRVAHELLSLLDE
jgi:hypothetical protein